MSGEKVKIEAKDLQGNQLEVVLREGRALEIKYPQKAVYNNVTVQSVHQFFKIVGKSYKNEDESLEVKDKAVLIADKRNGTLELTLNDEDKDAPEILGMMKTNPDLDGLRINKSDKFAPSDLAKYLRNHPQLVVVPEGENLRSITNKFLNISAKVTQELEKQNDDRGNITDSFVQTVSSEDLPEFLTVKAPIHLGCPDHELNLSIGVEKGNRCLLLYLYSADYELAKIQERRDVIEGEIAKFKTDGICVIETI